MDDILKVLGGFAILTLCLSWLLMAIILGTTFHLEGAWRCTEFDINKQLCVRYEYVGK